MAADLKEQPDIRPKVQVGIQQQALEQVIKARALMRQPERWLREMVHPFPQLAPERRVDSGTEERDILDRIPEVVAFGAVAQIGEIVIIT